MTTRISPEQAKALLEKRYLEMPYNSAQVNPPLVLATNDVQKYSRLDKTCRNCANCRRVASGSIDTCDLAVRSTDGAAMGVNWVRTNYTEAGSILYADHVNGNCGLEGKYWEPSEEFKNKCAQAVLPGIAPVPKREGATKTEHVTLEHNWTDTWTAIANQYTGQFNKSST